jgi:hypothetical protein
MGKQLLKTCGKVTVTGLLFLFLSGLLSPDEAVAAHKQLQKQTFMQDGIERHYLL